MLDLMVVSDAVRERVQESVALDAGTPRARRNAASLVANVLTRSLGRLSLRRSEPLQQPCAEAASR